MLLTLMLSIFAGLRPDGAKIAETSIEALPHPEQLFYYAHDRTAFDQTNDSLRILCGCSRSDQRRGLAIFFDRFQSADDQVRGRIYDLGKLDLIAIAAGRKPLLLGPEGMRDLKMVPGRGIGPGPWMPYSNGPQGRLPPILATNDDLKKARELADKGYFYLPKSAFPNNKGHVTQLHQEGAP